MENRHRDALSRFYEADRLLAKDGREPETFQLLHTGGMQSQISHPRWDDSWAIPSGQTIDDLGELRFLRVAPSLNQVRSFDLTMKGREKGEELELEKNRAPRPRESDRTNAATDWRRELDAAVATFLGRRRNDSFSADDLAEAVDLRKFDRIAAFRELQQREVEGEIERGGSGWRAVGDPGGPYFHGILLPVAAVESPHLVRLRHRNELPVLTDGSSRLQSVDCGLRGAR
jgi:hypothetical protein